MACFDGKFRDAEDRAGIARSAISIMEAKGYGKPHYHTDMNLAKERGMLMAKNQNKIFRVILIDAHEGKYSREHGSKYEVVNDTFFSENHGNFINLFTCEP
jgi:hypothetical protein